MLNQPVPDVTGGDVERIVKRDFPETKWEEIHSILSEYGKESWQCGEARVRLAALKLSAGDPAKLREFVDRARLDYREVIARAEYPGYSVEVSSCGLPTDDEHCEHAAHAKTVVEEDWRQYQAWLES